MAKQHFYSRVPAKMSMFNRMDGYDTFAYSDGIEREQIEIDIAEVYDNKPSKDDATLIQTGSLPTVYSAFANDNGLMIESAMSFMQKDYTGERSAYMVHSLILDEAEKAAHFESLNGLPFDKSVFKTDLSDFDLTSFDSKPTDEYPELPLPKSQITNIAEVSAKYDVGMMKRAIYTMYMIACGKIKGLYLGMPGKVETISSDALELINALLSVFPYHMRYQMSFVTYIGDQTKFPSFKIKGMNEKQPPAPTAKGVTLRMGMHDFYGVSDENIAQNAAVVDFFYSLLSEDNIRKEFLDYAAAALAYAPELKKPSVKNVTELVFLFRALSGYYEEKSVLPTDDDVYSYVTVYEKYRGALTDEYRARSMKPLKRYVEKSTAIPKNIFSKVSSLYAGETPVSKHNVMAIALDLFHTEAMRDKLFAFIKANYAGEDATSKNKIMHSVCRVYYGGFLQDVIIDFFGKTFDTEPEDIRKEILERLLLTIRTPKIQQAVLAFIDERYDGFTEAEKEKFYETFYEMLPDADSLTRALADIVDKHIDEAHEAAVSAAVIKAVTNDEKRKEQKLIAVLATKCGFVEATLAKKILIDWCEKPAIDRFVAAVSAKPYAERIETVRELWLSAPQMSKEASEKLLAGIGTNITKGVKLDIFDVIESEDKLDEVKADVPESADFIEKMKETVVEPIVVMLIPTVFEPTKGTDAIARLTDIAKKRTYIAKSDAYSSVTAYHNVLKYAKEGKGASIFETLVGIEPKNVRVAVANQLKPSFTKLEGETLVYANAAVSYATTGELAFLSSVGTLRDIYSASVRASGTEANAAAVKADEESLKTVLKVASEIYAKLPDEAKTELTKPSAEATKAINAFISRNEKKGKKTAISVIDSLEADGNFKSELKKNLSQGSTGGGFFSRLFGKK